MPPLLDKLIEKYNLTLNPEIILQELDLNWSTQIKNKDILKCPCPFHHEKNGESLIVNRKDNTFKCMEKSCLGSEGGNIIRLYSNMKDVSYEDAALQIFKLVGLDDSPENRVLKRNLYIGFSEKLTTEDLSQAAKNLLLLAHKEFPGNLVIISRLINIYTREEEKEKTCDYLLKAADIVSANRNYHSARTALKRVFTICPDNEKAKDLMGKIIASEWEEFYESQKTPRGEEALLESISGVEITPSARVKLTEVLLKHGREEMLKKLYSDFPEDLDDEQSIQLQEIASKLTHSIHKLNKPVAGFLLLSNILSMLRDFEPAKRALEDALKSAGEEASPDLKKEVEERLKSFEEVRVRKEYEHALVLMQTGQYEAALTSFEKTLEEGEITPEIADKLIHCHFRLEQYPEAARLCGALSDLYITEKKYEKAALALHRALLLEPANKNIIIKLIEIYKNLEKNDQAEEVAELSERQIVVQNPGWKETPTPPPQKLRSAPKDVSVKSQPEQPQETEIKKEPDVEPEKVYDISLPVKIKLYTSSASTDKITPVDGETISLNMETMIADCGAIKVPGIQPASINYVLQNCQIMGHLLIPGNVEPARIFGKIAKVQNKRVNNSFHKILTVALQESEDPGKKSYEKFVGLLMNGKVSLPTQEKPEETQPAPKAVKGKIEKELLVSTRFLDDSGEEKTPEYYYANTQNIGTDTLTLNYGDLQINGVPDHSLNYFLRNSVMELTIPLPEPNQTVRLLTRAKSVRSKNIRGKRSRLVEVEITESPIRDRQIYHEYIQSMLQ